MLLISVTLYTLATIINVTHYVVYLVSGVDYEMYMSYGDIFWVLGRFSMTLLFGGRLYYTFYNSALKVKKSTYHCIIAFAVLALIMYLSSSITIKFYDDPFLSSILTYFSVSHVLIDLVLNITIAVMFVKKLKILSNNSMKEDQQIIFRPLINKFSYLILIAIYSTVIATLLGGLFIFMSFPIPSIFMTYPGVGLDCIINSYVLYYSMGFTLTKYNNNCIKYEKCCLRCCCCIKY